MGVGDLRLIYLWLEGRYDYCFVASFFFELGREVNAFHGGLLSRLSVFCRAPVNLNEAAIYCWCRVFVCVFFLCEVCPVRRFDPAGGVTGTERPK